MSHPALSAMSLLYETEGDRYIEPVGATGRASLDEKVYGVPPYSPRAGLPAGSVYKIFS